MPNKKIKKKEAFLLNTSFNLKSILCYLDFNLNGIKNQWVYFGTMLKKYHKTAGSFFLKGFQDVLQITFK